MKDQTNRRDAKTQSQAMNGVQLIAAERTRQIEDEGYDARHDDKLKGFKMARAADSYITAVTNPDEDCDENGKPRPCFDWPFAKKRWKPANDPVRNLVKAGALIAAEIDRLLRASAPQR